MNTTHENNHGRAGNVRRQVERLVVAENPRRVSAHFGELFSRQREIRARKASRDNVFD